MVTCKKCGRPLANSKFYVGSDSEPYCPICVLGEEGKQSKYWEKGTGKNAGHPEGFRYPDDTAKYKYNYDPIKKKWVDKDGFMRPEWDDLKKEFKEPVKG